MKILERIALILGGSGFIGMCLAGYLVSLYLLSISTCLLVIACFIWEYAYQKQLKWHLRQLDAEREKYRNSLPKCLGGNGLNHFR